MADGNLMDVLNIYIVTGYTLYECTGTLQLGYIRLGRDTSIAGERGERQTSEDYHLFSRRPNTQRTKQSHSNPREHVLSYSLSWG